MTKMFLCCSRVIYIRISLIFIFSIIRTPDYKDYLPRSRWVRIIEVWLCIQLISQLSTKLIMKPYPLYFSFFDGVFVLSLDFTRSAFNGGTKRGFLLYSDLLCNLFNSSLSTSRWSGFMDSFHVLLDFALL